MSVIRFRRHRSGVIDQGVRSDKPSWAVGAGTAKDGTTVRRISEGNPPLKYERPRLGFNTTRTAGRNEFGLEKVCRRVSGSWSRRDDLTRRLEPAPQRPPLPKPQSFGFCRRHSIATTRSKRLLCFSRRTDRQTFGEVSDVVMESDVGKYATQRSNTVKHRPTPCVTDPASATTPGANANLLHVGMPSSRHRSRPEGGMYLPRAVRSWPTSSAAVARPTESGRSRHRMRRRPLRGCRRLAKSEEQAYRGEG